MAINSILTEIDAEIARLQKVKNLLSSADVRSSRKSTTAAKKRSKRRLSPDARERIAAAQRKRWAAAKKTTK